jgi:hypothetical protein
MKSRNVVTRTGRGFRAYVPSYKLVRMVEAESILEQDAILLFEFSRGVVSYQEQPELILYEFKGEIKRYFPDFELVLRSGEIIHIEVKPRSKLESLELREKLAAIAQHYERMGRKFLILTEDQIRINPTLIGNLRYLNRFQFHEGDFSRIKPEILKNITETSGYTVTSLSRVYGLVNVFVMLSRGYFLCDLSLQLQAKNNFVRLTTGDDDDSLFF